MKTLSALIKRNTKLFFKDKGMFFTSLITPMILLVLYATFLCNVYRDSFTAALPAGMKMAEELINGCVGGQLISSILAVSCVTVSFCSNMLMVQDKANGRIKDLAISPVRGSTLALGYYLSTLICTLSICLTATAVCLCYVWYVGWYMSVADVLLLILDVLLLTMFGTALSSVINFFLSTQGQISAVGSIVSSVYGFICGAYMPISQFSEGLQKAISLLPGTYGTSLVRNHALQGVFAEMETQGYPAEFIEGMRDVVDCNIYFFDNKVGIPYMYAYLCGTVILLVGAYVVMNIVKNKDTK
ncbi:MAG: ABC transporter permease [Clostridia bacterium]|nr:ABC transporter permease [Clostridia bacterium]